ncbi:putative sodium/metabolite cotransporter bass1, chloroplastic [Sarracenia purpurea var. burkii]
MPPIAAATVAVLCGNAIAQSASAILTSGRQVVLAAAGLILVACCPGVDAAGLLIATLQAVLLPVLGGALLNHYFQSLVRFVSPLMPPIAAAPVAVLCGNAIAQSASAILTSGRQVVLAAGLLHASGFFFGYLLSRIMGIDASFSRTISIEVGMQG